MTMIFNSPNRKKLFTEYEKFQPLYQQLIEELRFILERAINDLNLNIHIIQDRVKYFDSFYMKIISKQIQDNYFKKIEDIAGIRIICLYRSDLELIGKLICDNLQLIRSDLKTKVTRETEFGYMSDHYIVKLPKECVGARYNEIKLLKCEVQVRTILMDAWDSVSHHLDYKQEIDIPSQHKRDFYALSGLFYVADSHFEMFKNSVDEQKKKLAESVKKDQFDLTQEMNLDTLRAYLAWKLPKREKSKDFNYSFLLIDLKNIGYSDYRKLNRALDIGMPQAEANEKIKPPRIRVDKILVDTKYNNVGIVRECLIVTNDEVANYFREKWRNLPGK